MDKVKGLITESDFVELSKDFTTQKERLERVVADGEKQLAEIDDKIAVGDNRRELIEQYTNLEHLNREIVETLIDYISIGKRIPGTRNVPIEIHWNFWKVCSYMIAPEQKARVTYDNILRLCDDPDVRDPIKFLREREIVHYQRFGDALRITQDHLDSKNFYAYNPAFDRKGDK